MAVWFLLFDKQPLPPAENMARDEYLFNLCHKKKMGVFRIYSWKKPTFSFGVSQKINKAIHMQFIRESKDAFAYVRRITGGKTVLHNDEITYSVISSENIFYRDNDLFRSYMLISTVLVNAFNSLGLKAYLSKGSSSHLSKSNNPCFSFPTPNELEINGKKIVGSAQKRDNQALLQHGSIPLSMNYEDYAAGTRSKADLIKKSMTTLEEVSNITKEDLSQALINNFQDFIHQHLEVFEFDPNDQIALAELKKKYKSTDWNHRV